MCQVYAYLIRFAVVKEEDGWFSITCPGLGGVYAQGETEQEAMTTAASMAENILNLSNQFGDQIPENEDVVALRKPASKLPEGSMIFPAPWIIAAQNENCERGL